MFSGRWLHACEIQQWRRFGICEAVRDREDGQDGDPDRQSLVDEGPASSQWARLPPPVLDRQQNAADDQKNGDNGGVDDDRAHEDKGRQQTAALAAQQPHAGGRHDDRDSHEQHQRSDGDGRFDVGRLIDLDEPQQDEKHRVPGDVGEQVDKLPPRPPQIPAPAGHAGGTGHRRVAS